MEKPLNAPNPELRIADEFVRHTNCHIFLTGKAGTGKTTFLHDIQKKTLKRLVVTAPTGVAAINAGGVTLHSFFQMPFGPFVPGSEMQTGRHKLRREKINIIRSLDLLIPSLTGSGPMGGWCRRPASCAGWKLPMRNCAMRYGSRSRRR